MGIYDDVVDAMKTLEYFCSQSKCDADSCPMYESCERNLQHSLEDMAYDMGKEMKDSIRKGFKKNTSDAVI